MSWRDLDKHLSDCFSVGSSLRQSSTIVTAMQSMATFSHNGGLRGVQIIERAQFRKARRVDAKKPGPVAKAIRFMPVVHRLLVAGGSINSIANETGLNRCTVIAYKKRLTDGRVREAARA